MIINIVGIKIGNSAAAAATVDTIRVGGCINVPVLSPCIRQLRVRVLLSPVLVAIKLRWTVMESLSARAMVCWVDMSSPHQASWNPFPLGALVHSQASALWSTGAVLWCCGCLCLRGRAPKVNQPVHFVRGWGSSGMPCPSSGGQARRTPGIQRPGPSKASCCPSQVRFDVDRLCKTDPCPGTTTADNHHRQLRPCSVLVELSR